MNEKRFTFYYERGNEVVIEDNGKRLSNKKVVDCLNEQQATIHKLQDLCGQSDSENARLRMENKILKEKLNDCEKFRYTVFKRLNDEHIKECSIK